MRISAPPIRNPCHYGMDMSTREEMIAHERTVDEIAAELGLRLARLHLAGRRLRGGARRARATTATPASPATIRSPAPRSTRASSPSSSRSPGPGAAKAVSADLARIARYRSLPPAARARDAALCMPVRRIAVLALPGLQTLDVAGPVEVFHAAGAGTRSRSWPRAAGASRPPAGWRSAPLPAGAGRGQDRPPARHPDRRRRRGHARRRDPRRWPTCARAAPRARRVASVCTGAFVLAAAGLLDGRRATTHWAWCDALARRHPAVTVDPEPIWVRDGNVWTSAGVTAGMRSRARARRGGSRARRRAARRPRARRVPAAPRRAGAVQRRPGRAAGGRAAAARAAGLDGRPPRRRPERRAPGRARADERAHVPARVSPRDRHDARRLRRGRCASSARAWLLRVRPPRPSRPSPSRAASAAWRRCAAPSTAGWASGPAAYRSRFRLAA